MIDPLVSVGSEGTSWRTCPKYFQKAADRERHPGTVEISPAWFQLGHDVGSVFVTIALSS